MVHQGVDGLRQHSGCGLAAATAVSRWPHERQAHGAQDFRVAMTVLFHPDCYRRLRILTESADPKHWALAGWRKPAGRRITAGGDFHPALRNLVQLTPRKGHVQASRHLPRPKEA